MKIQKRFLRKHKDKDYYKYIVNLPPMIVKESGIEYGDEVEVKTEKGKIVLEKKQEEKKQTGKRVKKEDSNIKQQPNNKH